MKNEIMFNRIVNISLNISMGIFLTISVLLMKGTLSWETLAVSFIPGFCIGYVFGDVIPLQKIGDLVSRKLGCRPGSVPYFLMNVAVIAVIMTTAISFFCTFIGVGFGGFFTAWLSAYPILLAIGFLVEMIFLPLSLKLATKLTETRISDRKESQ